MNESHHKRMSHVTYPPVQQQRLASASNTLGACSPLAFSRGDAGAYSGMEGGGGGNGGGEWGEGGGGGSFAYTSGYAKDSNCAVSLPLSGRLASKEVGCV